MQTRALAGCIGGWTAIVSLVPSSTFAEDWTRQRTVERAVRAAGTLIVHRSGGRHDARRRVAEWTLRELGRVIRERHRRSRSRPQEWPDQPRGRPSPRPREGFDDPLVMPVVGVRWEELGDSFGDPRSGGRRHRGIDIFAPRWTDVVAAADGSLTSIGSAGRAGRALWLVGRNGRSYFYGHLQAWAGGIYDGMRVAPGHLIGYVGNSGNAAGLPTHLHFEIHEYGRAINPYPVLANAEPAYGPARTASRRGRSRAGDWWSGLPSRGGVWLQHPATEGPGGGKR